MQNSVTIIRNSLSGIYSESEISNFARLILEHITSTPYHLTLLDKHTKITEEELKKIEYIINRLKKFEPIQHILGVAYFYELEFNVSKDTLIPRPETEELAELIISNHKNEAISILDIGTGSGCIAITLAKNIPNSKVEAWDISDSALSVAKSNNQKNETNVNFTQVDVLSSFSTDTKFDVIVSNPPYILELEKNEMEKNVLDFEPHMALFVPNNNPLLFYERIADIAKKLLNKNGKLYFEINRSKGEETVNMLIGKGFSNVKLIKDISSNDRIVEATFLK